MLLQQGVRVESRRRSWRPTQPGGRRAGKSARTVGASYPGPVRARVLGVLLLAPWSASAAAVGAGLPATRRRRLRAARRPRCRPSRRACRSTRRRRWRRTPTTSTTRRSQPGLTFALQPMGNSVQAWVVPVPEGLAGLHGAGRGRVPPKERSDVRRAPLPPAGRADPDGGYSLRVKTVNDHVTPATMVAERLAGWSREAYGEVDVDYSRSRGLGEVHVPRRQQPAALQLLPVVRRAPTRPRPRWRCRWPAARPMNPVSTRCSRPSPAACGRPVS